MNRDGLIRAAARETGEPLGIVEQIVDAVFETIRGELGAGRPVSTAEPSKEALEAARAALSDNLANTTRDIERVVAIALDRFRAEGVEAERPADKIARGLRGALHVTKLAGEIIDLLPPRVATRELFHQVIKILSPHISEEQP